MKIARRIATATLAAALLCSMPFAEARTQTIEATGVYQMGENDTIATAKENAKKAALRAAAEQAGVYVRSYSKTKNLKLTDDQVEVISMQTMQVKNCTFTQDYTNNTLVIHAVIRATVDDDDFQNFQKRLDERDRIEDLQSQLDAEKAKTQAALNRKMQQSGDDPYASMIAEQELQKFQQNVQYAAVIRKEFADFVDQRAGVVPADIYGRMALLDLCTGSDLFQRDIDKAMEIAPKDPLYYTISALQALRQEDYYGAEALADQACDSTSATGRLTTFAPSPRASAAPRARPLPTATRPSSAVAKITATSCSTVPNSSASSSDATTTRTSPLLNIKRSSMMPSTGSTATWTRSNIKINVKYATTAPKKSLSDFLGAVVSIRCLLFSQFLCNLENR